MSDTDRPEGEPGADRREQTDRRSQPDRRADDRYTLVGTGRGDRRQGERRRSED